MNTHTQLTLDKSEANFNSLLQDYQAIENEAGRYALNPANNIES